VQVAKCLKDLNPVALHLHLSKSFPSFDLIIQGLIAAQFQHDVNILIVFKEVIETNNVLVVE
jgi:hypothetical protein